MDKINQQKNQTLKEMVYDKLFDDILGGVFKPEAVITEKELVERFGISKSPIREALIELCNEGVLRSIPRYGYEIIKITESDIMDAKASRIILEAGALDKYFDRIVPADIERLQALLDNKPSEEMGILQHWQKNSAFHLALMDIYGNKFMSSMLKSALDFMTRAYVQYQYNKYKQMKFHGTAMNHREVLQAIRKGDKENAVKLLAADIGNFETTF